MPLNGHVTCHLMTDKCYPQQKDVFRFVKHIYIYDEIARAEQMVECSPQMQTSIHSKQLYFVI